MDKKLLLTIQWACNKKGVKIPWEMVGHEIGETITDSAVVQHLAKLRTRMVYEDLPVPPPLTRGGRNNKTDVKSNVKSDIKKPGPYRVTKRASKTNKTKKTNAAEDESDTDSDGEYDSEDELANDAAKKGKKKNPAKKTVAKKTVAKKASAKTCVKKERSSNEHTLSPNAIESDSDQEPTEQSYAVGDGMWDLAAKGNARSKGKRVESKSSSQSSYGVSKPKVDRVNTKAPSQSSYKVSKSKPKYVGSKFAGPFPYQAYGLKAERNESNSSGQSSNRISKIVKLKIGQETFAKLRPSQETHNSRANDSEDQATGYGSSNFVDKDHDMSSVHDGPHSVASNGGDFYEGLLDFGDAFGKAADQIQQYQPAPYRQEMDLGQHYQEIYGSMASNQMDTMVDIGPIEFPAEESSFAGETNHHGAAYVMNTSNPYENSQFTNAVPSDVTQDATCGAVAMSGFTGGNLFPGSAQLPGYNNVQTLTASPFGHGGFFEAAYSDASVMDFSGANETTGKYYESPGVFNDLGHSNNNSGHGPAGQFGATFGIGGTMTGDSAAAADNTSRFDAPTYTSVSHQTDDQNPQRGFPGNRRLGSPFVPRAKTFKQAHDSLTSSPSYQPAFDDFSGYGNGEQGAF